jgi:hypothetical protein
MRRTSGPEHFHSTAEKDFFNTIRHLRSLALTDDKIVLGELGQFNSPVHARQGTP